MDNITSLQISNGKVGTGAEATAGKTVSVHYTGWLYDPKTADHKGKKFDSSKDHGDPFEFKLGARQVIAGWDQGVAGMKVGGDANPRHSVRARLRRARRRRRHPAERDAAVRRRAPGG